jgi:transcriptional regulator GlxA family with amidase domain
MKHITILAIDRSLGTSITIPLEMLNAALLIARLRNTTVEDFNLQIIGVDTRPVELMGGLTVKPQSSIARVKHSDFIFIPALWGSPLKIVRRSPLLIQWLVDRYNAGATLCSITTGSYFLAEAGLLDKRMATTHWYFFDNFQKHFPHVLLQRKRFITLSDRLYCTGSINAARDVMLHLIEQLFDASIVNEVSRHFTHEVRRSYESLLLKKSPQDSHHDEQIIKIQEWLQSNYAQPIQLQSVARRFKISVRSLNRRFKVAADTTPLRYLQEIRIQHAKELLKRSNLSIAEICYQVGYQDTSYFSSLFKQMNGVTPLQYRDLVRTKLFKVENQTSDKA